MLASSGEAATGRCRLEASWRGLLWLCTQADEVREGVEPQIEIKVLVVALSGIGAAVHQTAKGNKAMLAVGGAMSSLFGAAAMWVGIAMPI